MFAQGSAVTILTDGSLLLFKNVFIFRLHWVFVVKEVKPESTQAFSSRGKRRGLLFLCLAPASRVQWLLSLQSTGSKLPGFGGCGVQAQ